MTARKENKMLKRCMKLNEELRKILIDNPTLPVVVMRTDIPEDEKTEYYWQYSEFVKVKIGEVLDCENLFKNDQYRVYTERFEFYESVSKWVYEDADENPEKYRARDKEDEECIDDAIDSIIDSYRPFWKKAIILYAGC